jgi:hypothetical protein
LSALCHIWHQYLPCEEGLKTTTRNSLKALWKQNPQGFFIFCGADWIQSELIINSSFTNFCFQFSNPDIPYP